MPARRTIVLLLAGLGLTPGAPAAEPARHVVMVSVDALMPAYCLRADELGLRIPNLRRLMTQGAYGRVTGVLPSVTYPSHTTLITGVPPRVHGIVSNYVFDPEGSSLGAWTWYASWIRVPTLVSAARARGLSTASVSWPVSVGLAADQLLPEFSRGVSRHPSDLELLDALSTPGLLAETARERGRPFGYPLTDADRVDVAAHVLRRHRPRLLLLHLLDLDSRQHDFGPFAPEARQAVEQADAELGRLLQAVEEAGLGGRTVFAVVSDHGFLPVRQALKPNARLREAGLVTLDEKNKVTAWRAWFQAEGGSAALRLADPRDAATLQKVRALFSPEAGRPGSGIARLLEEGAIERLGGDAESPLVLDAEAGFAFQPAADGAYLGKTRHLGTHGHAPDREELQAALVITGAGLGGDLGVVPMTSIAPTLARSLGVELSPQAGPPLAPPGERQGVID